MSIDILTAVQLALQYGGIVKEIWDGATTNGDVASKIKAMSPALGRLLDELGKSAFPDASATLHTVGGIVAGFDPNITKWLQSSLNAILTPSPNLAVDGIYGPRTTAAVKKLQLQAGLVPDGLAGRITQAAIDAWFAKKEQTNIDQIYNIADASSKKVDAALTSKGER